MKKASIYLRIVAAATLISYCVTNSHFAYAQTSASSICSDQIKIPARLGSTEETFTYPSGKTVIYIQDAHDSLEAQKNIAKLIEGLVKHYGIKTVYEEGYEGPVPTDRLFKIIPDSKIRRKVSDFLLDKLRIGGAEYAHINRQADFRLIGADHLDLYKKNIRAFREASKNNRAIEKDLDAILTEVESLANLTFPKSFKEWLKIKDRFDANQTELLLYLKKTARTAASLNSHAFNPALYPNILLLLTAETSKNISLLEKAKAIDAKTLFDEIAKLEEAVAAEFLKEDRDIHTFRHRKALRLLKRLNQLEVNPGEYSSARDSLLTLNTQGLANFIAKESKKSLVLSKSWESSIQKAAAFYEIAHQRDLAIEKSLKEFIDHSKERKAVLVYGGFHKENIRAILQKLGVNYHIITPKITALSPAHQSYYKELMTAGHHGFEKAFMPVSATRPPSILLDEGLALTQLRALNATVSKNPNLPVELLDRSLSKNIPRSEVRSKNITLNELVTSVIKLNRWHDVIDIDIDPNLETYISEQSLRTALFELIKNAIDGDRVYKKKNDLAPDVAGIFIRAEESNGSVLLHVKNQGILALDKLRAQAKRGQVLGLNSGQNPALWPYPYMMASQLTDEPMPYRALSDEEVDNLSDETLLFQIKGLTLRNNENLARIGMSRSDLTGGMGIGLKLVWRIMKEISPEKPISYETGSNGHGPWVQFTIRLPLARSEIRSESNKKLLEFYEALYQKFMTAQPKVSSDGVKTIFDPVKISSGKDNFEFYNNAWRPKPVDVHSLYIPLSASISDHLDKILDEITVALPSSQQYYRSPKETFHFSILVPQDLRPTDVGTPEGEARRLTQDELTRIKQAFRETLGKIPAYDARFIGLRLNPEDGVLFAVFEDNGETSEIRKQLTAEGNMITPKIDVNKYPKNIVHVSLLRFLNDISEETLAKLKLGLEKYRDQSALNQIHRVTSMEFGHELRWMHTEFEPTSKIDLPLRSEVRAKASPSTQTTTKGKLNYSDRQDLDLSGFLIEKLEDAFFTWTDKQGITHEAFFGIDEVPIGYHNTLSRQHEIVLTVYPTLEEHALFEKDAVNLYRAADMSGLPANGSFGNIVLRQYEWQGKPALLIRQIQSSPGFHSLTPDLKKNYGGWKDAAVETIIQTSKSSGYQDLFVNSHRTIREQNPGNLNKNYFSMTDQNLYEHYIRLFRGKKGWSEIWLPHEQNNTRSFWHYDLSAIPILAMQPPSELSQRSEIRSVNKDLPISFSLPSKVQIIQETFPVLSKDEWRKHIPKDFNWNYEDSVPSKTYSLSINGETYSVGKGSALRFIFPNGDEVTLHDYHNLFYGIVKDFSARKPFLEGKKIFVHYDHHPDDVEFLEEGIDYRHKQLYFKALSDFAVKGIWYSASQILTISNFIDALRLVKSEWHSIWVQDLAGNPLTSWAFNQTTRLGGFSEPYGTLGSFDLDIFSKGQGHADSGAVWKNYDERKERLLYQLPSFRLLSFFISDPRYIKGNDALRIFSDLFPEIARQKLASNNRSELRAVRISPEKLLHDLARKAGIYSQAKGADKFLMGRRISKLLSAPRGSSAKQGAPLSVNELYKMWARVKKDVINDFKSSAKNPESFAAKVHNQQIYFFKPADFKIIAIQLMANYSPELAALVHDSAQNIVIANIDIVSKNRETAYELLYHELLEGIKSPDYFQLGRSHLFKEGLIQFLTKTAMTYRKYGYVAMDPGYEFMSTVVSVLVHRGIQISDLRKALLEYSVSGKALKSKVDRLYSHNAQDPKNILERIGQWGDQKRFVSIANLLAPQTPLNRSEVRSWLFEGIKATAVFSAGYFFGLFILHAGTIISLIPGIITAVLYLGLKISFPPFSVEKRFENIESLIRSSYFFDDLPVSKKSVPPSKLLYQNDNAFLDMAQTDLENIDDTGLSPEQADRKTDLAEKIKLARKDTFIRHLTTQEEQARQTEVTTFKSPNAWRVISSDRSIGFVLSALNAENPVSNKQLAWQDFHRMVFDFPIFYETAAAKKLPLVLIVPENLDGLTPLDALSPWIEGARTTLAWASAYARFEKLGGLDLRILKVPQSSINHAEKIRAAAASLMRLPAIDTYLTPEDKVLNRIYNLESMPLADFGKVVFESVRPPAIQEDIKETFRPPALSDNQKRVVISGGAGFLGSHITKRLLDKGHQVVVIDNLLSGNADNLSPLKSHPSGLVYYQSDISKPFDIEGSVDFVLHFASLATPGDYYDLPKETLLSGLAGTKNMLDLAHRKRARFLTSSTSEVYGQPLVHPQPETYPGNVNPIGKRSQYDQSKRGGETLVKLYYEKYGLDVRISRIFNTYGPGMRFGEKHDTRLIPNFIKAILNGQPMEMFGGGGQTRSFAFVDDTINGLLSLLETDNIKPKSPIQERVFNIGNPHEFTVKELAEKLIVMAKNLFGIDASFVSVHNPDKDDPLKRKPDILKAKTVLGFSPDTSLDEGLQKTFLDFKNRHARSEIREYGQGKVGMILLLGVLGTMFAAVRFPDSRPALFVILSGIILIGISEIIRGVWSWFAPETSKSQSYSGINADYNESPDALPKGDHLEKFYSFTISASEDWRQQALDLLFSGLRRNEISINRIVHVAVNDHTIFENPGSNDTWLADFRRSSMAGIINLPDQTPNLEGKILIRYYILYRPVRQRSEVRQQNRVERIMSYVKSAGLNLRLVYVNDWPDSKTVELSGAPINYAELIRAVGKSSENYEIKEPDVFRWEDDELAAYLANQPRSEIRIKLQQSSNAPVPVSADKRGTVIISTENLSALTPDQQDELFKTAWTSKSEMRFVVYGDENPILENQRVRAFMKLSNVKRANTASASQALKRYAIPGSTPVVLDKRLSAQNLPKGLKRVLIKELGAIAFAKLYAMNGGAWAGVTEKDGVIDPSKEFLSGIIEKQLSHLVVAYSA